MIIGLTGKKQHGKDTVGSILVEEHGYARLAYADALKQSAAALFNVPSESWNEWKNDPTKSVMIRDMAGGVLAEMTVRRFLQRYGTESHRDVFGESFWLDVVEEQIEQAVDEHRNRPDAPKVVVTDVRFDNEAAVIRRHGGVVVEVYRPQIVDEADAHASEDLPRADLMLWNGDDIETLRQRVAQCEREGWAAVLL